MQGTMVEVENNATRFQYQHKKEKQTTMKLLCHCLTVANADLGERI